MCVAGTRNWRELSEWARGHRKLFSASVGPGYNDTRIRPWNVQATRHRKDGAYYQRMWDAAIDAQPDYVSITSFNEWGAHAPSRDKVSPRRRKNNQTHTHTRARAGEGTQIEPAVTLPSDDPHGHLGYSDPFLYLEKTAGAKSRWRASRRTSPAGEL